ncbi:glycosyltransferase family 9 protein [Serratia proteamaculans]|jgi:ADP-heptose:LPS heptosyltransferase|uniref:glycosyltransferase family 9 protein n=1 Tax=Serratia TaxID=613 RepID=UPI000BFFCE52|nr:MULTISPECIES: glycosyltransferase family 9 protein [Serratia]MDW5510417.1 glycosyltransferase family 9 protein [Serratia proteamaculans]
MKILIIRRENIGDLILTTPLIALLGRDHKIDILVNTYNSQVIDENPHLNKIYLYTKLHHEKSLKAKVFAILLRVKTSFNIWRERYDVAIVAGNWDKRPLQWARLSRAKRIIAIGEDAPNAVTDKVPYTHGHRHIVEELSQLAKPLGYDEAPGKLELYLKKSEIIKAEAKLGEGTGVPIYGLQISSRKEKQRWPAEKFIALAHSLSEREPCKIILFWSPGASDNPTHPGDDDKAKYIVRQCKDFPLLPFETKSVRDLMAGMSLCDQIITSDGGALHVAAGVERPVVALFGNSDAFFWSPWKVPARVLEAPNEDVSNLTVPEVLDAFISLRAEVLTSKNLPV